MADTPIREWQLRMLANSLEYRGNDATGFALQDKSGKIVYIKAHEPAWKFTSGEEYRNWMEEHLTEDTVIALVHTRKATKGSPYQNKNNHPICNGAGAVVHNGFITNDDQIFADKAVGERGCETDSDAIRAILDTHGRIDKQLVDEMCLLEGVAAVAAIHPASPGKLLLLRDSNPLIVGATREMLMFASDKRAIHRAMKPWVRLHKIIMQVHAPDLAFVPMANQTGWIIGDEGLEWHGEFKCNTYGRAGNTKYQPATDYKQRQKRFRAEAIVTIEKPVLPRYVICPNTNCARHVEIGDEFRKANMTLGEIMCRVCKTNLAGALTAEVRY